MLSHVSSSAVHDVLRNPSLVSEILSFVTRGPTISTNGNHRRIGFNLKTCLSVALSCKWLMEPALDEIWSKLNDLRPLVQLLPGLETKNSKMVTLKPILRSHLYRIEHHARRVRSLDISYTDNPRPLTWAEPSLFVQLLLLLRGEPLLPHLSYLAIHRSLSVDQVALFSVILPLLPCATLRQVILRPSWVGINPNDQRYLSIYSNFSTNTVPPISQFLNAMAIIPTQSLEVLDVAPEISLRVVKTLQQFPRLQSLSFTGPTPGLEMHLFHHICVLEDLRCLKTALVPISIEFRSPAHPSVFHSLEKLDVSSSIQTITTLLTSFKFTSLKKLLCRVVGQAPLILADLSPRTWQQCWDALVQLITEELQNLEAVHMVWNSHNNVPNVSWHSCTPFLRLRYLRTLSLLGQKVISITHTQFIALANSLPHLQTLKLDINELSPIFLQFLIEIKTRFLSLEQLSLPLDWRTVSPGMLPRHIPYDRKHPLSSLDIVRIPADHAIEITKWLAEGCVAQHGSCHMYLAEFLFRLFPGVTFSLSPSIGIAGLQGYVMRRMAELKARVDETDRMVSRERHMHLLAQGI